VWGKEVPVRSTASLVRQAFGVDWDLGGLGALERRLAVRTTVVGVAYFAAARFGLSLAFTTKQVTTVWPPTGIALVAFLVWGIRVWPGVFIAALVANAMTYEALPTALGIAVGNTCAGILGAAILVRVGFEPRFRRVRDVCVLVAVAAVTPLVSATSGVANLAVGGIVDWPAYPSVWSVWWVGDAMGILLFAPLLLTWPARPRPTLSPQRVLEAAALVAGLVLVAYATLTDAVFETGSRHELYAVFPFLIWAALRFGAAVSAWAVVLVGAVVVSGTVNDRGPFATGSIDHRLATLELFLAVAALVGMTLAAVMAERDDAQAALRCANDGLERRVTERTQDLERAHAGLAQVISENSPNGAIVMFGRDLRLQLVRGEGLNLIGIDPAAVEGVMLAEAFDPDTVATLEPLIQEALAGTDVRARLALRSRQINVNIVPLRSETGSVVAATLIGEDITAQHETEQALRISEDRRNHALARLLEAQEHERVRIAADLHDDTIQAMTAALLRLDSAQHVLAPGDRAHDRVARARATLAEAIERTRKLTFDLRPQLLEAEGLAAAVADLARHASDHAGFQLELDLDVTRYSDVIESLVFRTVHEALINIQRHADAHSVRIEVRDSDGIITGAITDDGAGFDVASARARARATHHFGLDTSSERLRLAGGNLTLISTPGDGTRVTFALPAHRTDDGAAHAVDAAARLGE
jgi:signal transduction histidine kinase